MPRDRKGYVFQDNNRKWYARVTVTDETGKRRNIKRRATDKANAKQLLKALVRELHHENAEAKDTRKMTFADLAAFYEQTYLHPAEYVHERKISGLRALDTAQRALRLFRDYFGSRNLTSITYGDLYSFRLARLRTKTQYGRPRTIASVNRELVVLRRILNIGVREGWMFKNPFNCGDALISAVDENKRERILERDEEARLLAAVDSEPKRQHLRGILLIALDCALRRGEIFKLRWSDIDLQARTITVRSMNCKTARSRVVAMTVRVFEELDHRWLISRKDADDLIFGIRVTIETAFRKVCKAAKVSDFKFHDCRHTAISRLVRVGIPPVEVMRVSGHATLSCLYRYSNLDSDSVFRAAAALDAFHNHAPVSAGQLGTEFVN